MSSVKFTPVAVAPPVASLAFGEIRVDRQRRAAHLITERPAAPLDHAVYRVVHRTGEHGGLERREVRLEQRALGDLGLVVVAPALGRPVRGEVLGRGHERGGRRDAAVALEAAHLRHAHRGA